MVNIVADGEGRFLLVAVHAAAGCIKQMHDRVVTAGLKDVKEAD